MDMQVQEIRLADVERITSIRVYCSLKEAQEFLGNGMVVKEQGKEIYYVMPNVNKTFNIVSFTDE